MTRLLLCAAATVLALPAAAAAQPVTYTYTTTLTGTLAGSSFSGAGTFTGVAETDATTAFDGFPALDLSSFTLLLGGTTYRITTPVLFFSNNDYGIAGFVAQGSETNGFSFYSPGFIDYTGVTDLSAATIDNYVDAAFVTDGGTLTLTGQGAGSFVAVVGAAAAVPEPAGWAMLIVGFGLIGRALRRQDAGAPPAFAR